MSASWWKSLAAVLACISIVAATPTNHDTSLRILYQNNLNATDDVNHTPFLILDPVAQSKSAGACSAFGETLLTQSAIQAAKSDFQRSFAYLEYSGYRPEQFFIQNGILSVSGNGAFSVQKSGSRARALPVLCTQSKGAYTADTANEIQVSSGKYSYVGSRNRKSFQFLGVPFANEPARFEYPTAYSGTNHLIQATSYQQQCAQASSGSEDCLYLNIFSPYLPKAGSSRDLKPVLFWIHGGGFTGGNGQTDGSNLASREDIVFVSIQYRLSTLGFLAVPGTDVKGNYGIADQIAALNWVKQNIAAFGGDPTKITLMGESAGAGSVRVLLGSPPAIGKYAGAIAMSNLGGGVALGLQGDYSTTYSSYLTIQGSYDMSQALFAEAGCSQTSLQAQITCLKAVPALTLVELPTVARYVVQDGTIVNTEQLIVSKRNASTAHVPVMFGNLADDGASFINYPKTPVTSLSAGIQQSIGISAAAAQQVLSSGLFPDPSTGNITLDAFNISSRLYTDVGFRCIDQATLYASQVNNVFPSAYYYQFDRSIGGYDPNNVGNPPPAPGYPLGDPHLPYFKVHAGDVAAAFADISASQIREPQDLWFTQLVSGYWAEFAKSQQPNPPIRYLQARGYTQTLQAVQKGGQWEAVGKSKRGSVQIFDWPPHRDGYLDLNQCQFLNYSLSYYIDSNRG